MAGLTSLVQELNRLILAGHTLEAMEQFYADGVTMQENEGELRIGRAVCLNHEKQMLASVSALKATLLHQAIDENTGIVFSEWRFAYTDLTGNHFSLAEVSVQQWQNERIRSEKFYYNKILTVS